MAVPLTADLCAIAIIASARSLGEDPIVALTGRKLRGRQSRSRCLRPAALALYEATDCHQGRLCLALGADRFGLNAVRDSYREAFEAARRAIASSATTVPVVNDKKAASAGIVVAPPLLPRRRRPRRRSITRRRSPRPWHGAGNGSRPCLSRWSTSMPTRP